ncbi:(d)CMP kinase [Dolosigranulum savutiense]|uniref:Cytidylate kinase n=1 Tax=Dolosigranulum savutiense TaxID=3110288 RepID=A0AB74U582_9LACT
MSKHLTIAVDGPASSGKSTVAKAVANRLGLTYIDTGAMYRSITLYALQKNIDMEDEKAVAHLLNDVTIRFEEGSANQHVWLNHTEVTEAIRQEDVTRQVSLISSYRSVREKLVEQQRQMAESKDVIMDGRDIGTVVLPNATKKFFLKASAEERARRRTDEYKQKGIQVEYQQVLADIQARDQYDSNRAISPLKKPHDAIVIDSTTMTIDEVVEAIIQNIQKN